MNSAELLILVALGRCPDGRHPLGEDQHPPVPEPRLPVQAVTQPFK
jgi:hypothetical protein